MPEKIETLLVQKCLAWVKEQGGYAIHLHGSSMQSAGQPDLLGAVPDGKGGNVHFLIEVKVGDNQPSKIQLARLATWSRLGFLVGVAWSLQDFVQIIRGENSL